MYESLLASNHQPLGTQFLGEVTEANFITATAFTTLVGMDGVGQLTNASVNWLKYTYKNKTVYMAKKAIRHAMTWEALDTRGLTKGTTQFTIGGKQYTVRLPTGWLTPPSSTYAKSDGGSFNDLVYPVYGGVGVNSPEVQYYPRLANYSDEALGLYVDKTSIVANPGSMTWCQDLLASGTAHMCRAYWDPDNSGTLQILGGWYINLGGTQNYAGWRPILEEV